MVKFLHNRCDSQIEFLRERIKALEERNDRLTEALAHKTGIPLTMPYATVPSAPLLADVLKGQGGWFDNRPPVPVLKVSVPDKKEN